MGKVGRRPQAAKSLLRGTKPLYHRPLIRPSVRTGAPSPQGEGLRAGEDTRPYGIYRNCPFFCRGRSQTGPREGHTPGWLLSAFGRFTFSPSPTGFKKLFRIWVGEVLGSPAGIRTSHHLLGKTRRSRGIAPAAILEQPGPSGPGGNANRHSDFARRKYSSIFQVRVPRKWGPRGRRIWTRSVHPEPPPSGSLVTFWPSRKSLAARRRRNPSARIQKAARRGRRALQRCGKAAKLPARKNTK